MSLVAYGASDDSETSDGDEAEVLQVAKSGNANNHALADDGKISDEEDYIPTVSRNAASSTNETGFHSIPAPSSLSDLPAPKPAPLSLSQGEGQGEGEDELEDEVKPKASQLADAPKPPPKKNKQPTRIVIPALKQDSDEEEDVGRKKTKQATATAGSGKGLFALLPPPVHSSRKQTNRPLIPYTLTKRPTPSKPTTASSTTPTSSRTAVADPLPSKKHQSAFNALTGYESDSDEEESGPSSGSVDFFTLGGEASGGPVPSGESVLKNFAPSLGEEGGSTGRTSDSGDARSSERNPDVQSSSSALPSSPKHVSLTKSDSPVSSTSVSSSGKVDSVTVSAAAETTQDSPAEEEEGDSGGENEVTSTVGIPRFNQDAPLSFNSSIQGCGWSSAPLASPMLPEMYAAPSSSSLATYWQRQQHYAQDQSTEMQQEVDSGPGSSSGSNIQEYMEDQQFLRISGKRKRGQEDIQIIDANVDDYVDPNDLMKGISEESSYQPHRKKDNMPSTQQRRKKQITYLAFQAKERELELKNAWSQNRMTKNQSRSKYGF